ncbi:hypothetical protein H5410_040992, partial [Solanum commersonii]
EWVVIDGRQRGIVENSRLLPFFGCPKLMGEEHGEAIMAGECWEGGEVAPIGEERSMFAMYNLRLADFNEVFYVQPPVGGV